MSLKHLQVPNLVSEGSECKPMLTPSFHRYFGFLKLLSLKGKYNRLMRQNNSGWMDEKRSGWTDGGMDEWVDG